MDADQAWRSALGQLQLEMPKASFDTWVRDAHLVSYEDGLFTIGVRNSYCRDWLESRLVSTAARLLAGIVNQSVDIRFVVEEPREEDPEAASPTAVTEELTEGGRITDYDPGTVLRGHSRYLTAYEKIVRPHRVIVVPGYLTRLLPERGASAILAYIGFSQVAWMNSKREEDGRAELTFRAPIVSVAKFAGANRTAFYKLLNSEAFWKSLEGLVRKEPQNRYTLFRTLPLSWQDARAVHGWLSLRMGQGRSLESALQEALDLPSGSLVGRLLSPISAQSSEEADSETPVYVPEIARSLSGRPELEDRERDAAEALHIRIIYAFKDLAVRHYFMTEVIRRAGLTPDQAALVLVSRYRCYANPLTGEVVNTLHVPGGYGELAAWIGLSRPKTIWEWVSGYSREVVGHDGRGHKQLSNVRRGGIPAFLVEAQDPAEGSKIFCVRLLEPVEFGDPSGESWRIWDPATDHQSCILSMRQTLPQGEAGEPGKGKADKWSVDELMSRAGVFPQVKDKLIKSGVDAAHFLSWVYFCFSLQNTSGYRVNSYPVKMLSLNPQAVPGEGFYRLACLPPSMIRLFVDATSESLSAGSERTGLPDWDELMGNHNPEIRELDRILFGE